MGGAVDDRRVHDLARAAGGACVLEGGKDADDEIERAARVVADQIGGDGGRLAGLADHGERAGEGDVRDVVSGPLGERPVLAPAGHPPVDEPGIAGETGVGADAETFGDARPVALDQDVGTFDQVQDAVRAALGLEVDEHGTFVAVGEVVRGIDTESRSGGPVDPDDIGAEVGQEHRGERAGADARQFHHAYARQWAVLCRCHQAPSGVTQLM